MHRTLRSIIKIRGASGANRLIYYFRRLPLVGKLLRDDVYARTDVKQVLTVIVQILKVLWGFLGKFIYLGLIIYWPVTSIGKDLLPQEQYSLYLQLVLLLSFVAAGVSSAVILEPKMDKYICVKLMRLPAGQYMRATMALRGVSFGLYFIPAMMVFAGLLAAPLWQGVLLAVLLTFWRMLCEALHLWLFERKGIVLVKQTAAVWIVIGAMFLLGAVTLYGGRAWFESGWLFNLPAVTAILLVGGLASLYIARYPNYRKAVDAVSKIDEPLLNMGRMMKDAQAKDIRSDEQETVLRSGMEVHADKTGYSYLNAIFFDRHKRLLIQPLKRCLAGCAVLLCAGLLALALSPELFIAPAQYLRSGMLVLIFVMGFITVGEKACKAMFYNCDMSLLRYGFYRKQGAVMSNFRIRLARIAGLNLIAAAAVGLAVNLPLLLSPADWTIMDAALFCLAAIGLALFYSVHHMFMYYMFQPYGTEMNIKNPFFMVVNSIVMAVGGVGLVLRSDAEFFAPAALALALVYAVLALILVRRFHARTFRLK
ncbi:hypothetical protein [Paenibacillus tengchongensis]|uniref:hypothetical protein n=1 Tax=Paenibacillus tengchongensis TaxID=2608684 RepID=UPI00124ED877|nr:hypothetical protein [Paenibacillus tengchongensis]